MPGVAEHKPASTAGTRPLPKPHPPARRVDQAPVCPAWKHGFLPTGHLELAERWSTPCVNGKEVRWIRA